MFKKWEHRGLNAGPLDYFELQSTALPTELCSLRNLRILNQHNQESVSLLIWDTSGNFHSTPCQVQDLEKMSSPLAWRSPTPNFD